MLFIEVYKIYKRDELPLRVVIEAETYSPHDKSEKKRKAQFINMKVTLDNNSSGYITHTYFSQFES
jgi:hypothetical protein